MLRAAAVLAMLVTAATRPSGAMSPCRPYLPVPLTGTLLEVREGTRVLGTDEAVALQTPPFACLAPVYSPQAIVTLTDCWFPDVSADGDVAAMTTTASRVSLTACLLLASCNEPPPCDVPKLEVATGSGDFHIAELTAGAQQQRISIAADRTRLEYTFVRDGVSYTAVYALGEMPPPPALRYVSIRRPPPLATCADLASRGPTIDAIEIRRAGVVIATGGVPNFASDRCPRPDDKGPPSLAGPPDGQGVALAGNELAWPLSGDRMTLRPGDEVTVTVLDGSNEPYQVFAGPQPLVQQLQLGTLTGSGTVTVPAR